MLNKGAFHLFHVGILGLTLFFALLLNISRVAAQTATFDKSLSEAIASTVAKQYNVGSSRIYIDPANIQSENTWTFGTVAIMAPPDIHGGPEGMLFIAKQVGKDWQVFLQYTTAFDTELANVPITLIKTDVRPDVRLSSPNAPQTGYGASNLSLPWATGVTAYFTGGPHSNDGTGNRPWSAVDFVPDDGAVRAANSGRAWRDCPDYVRVDHGNGYQTGYYHLRDIQVSHGQSVNRGQILGYISTNVGCGGRATGVHTHFSLRDGGNNKIEMHDTDLGGWRVRYTPTEYDGCMDRLGPNPTTVCKVGRILNTGGIASNAGDPAPPSIVAPANNSTVTTVSVPIQVQAGGFNYTGQADWLYGIARDSGFSQSYQEIGFTTSNPLTINFPATGLWWVRVKQGDRVSLSSYWSSAVSFTIQLATNTPTKTPSSTPTNTFTPSNTPTATPTPSNTPTETLTPSSTLTNTFTPSNTPTATPTPSNTPTETLTPSNTPTNTSTVTNTPIPSRSDTIGVYKAGVWYLRNSNDTGFADITAVFGGNTSDLPVVGDWNGDGVDTIGVYRGSMGVYYLSDSNTVPAVSYNFVFGNPGDTPFAGKWDSAMTGSGVGVYRNSNGILYQKKQLTTGFADFVAVFGNPGDQGVGGDWNADGFDSVGIYRSSNERWYLSNNNTPNGTIFADFDFIWTIGNNLPVVGDWDDDGDTNPGYLTSTGVFTLHPNNAIAGIDNTFVYGPPDSKAVSGKWTSTSRPALGVVISGQSGSVSNNADTDNTD
jgi:murein DD-endopeptidase MepM/ murein hydrolase activator NlpD